MLVKCAALETAFYGIRINAVAPGVTSTYARMKKGSTEYTEGQNTKFLKEAARDVPLFNEINSPEDIADAMLFLASDHASYVTGEIMVVDGGQSLTSNTYDDYIKEFKAARGEGFATQLFGK